MKQQLVLPEIDYEFECAGRKNAFGLVLPLVAFVQPKIVYKLRKRWFRLVKVQYRVDIERRKLSGFAACYSYCGASHKQIFDQNNKDIN